ncbi:hypothetical protein [Chitinimonas koreensis]|uniref:hypothetical protein n=1 Tax=Chitinimonas koreensis TaxID=356302 RepID=UPI00041F7B1C|nr:hypothetical protein [Chitinimonas koreensis]QNM98108.1 hypothetical protein H9L41_07610 [Chitinimonas koreensis]
MPDRTALPIRARTLLSRLPGLPPGPEPDKPEPQPLPDLPPHEAPPGDTPEPGLNRPPKPVEDPPAPNEPARPLIVWGRPDRRGGCTI